MRLDASSSSEPKDWVNAPAASLQPSARMASAISSRACFQLSTRSSASSRSASVDGPVDGDPAHELRVEEVPGLAADLPDALVLLTPARGGGVGEIGEEAAGGRAEPLELLGESVHRVEQLAVDVDLALVPGAVADAHGRAVAPTAQVRQLALGEVAFATDAEHDLQVVAASYLCRGRVGEVVEELVGFVGAGGDPQRLQREATRRGPRRSGSPSSGNRRRTPATMSSRRRRSHRWGSSAARRARGRCGGRGPSTARRSAGATPTTYATPASCPSTRAVDLVLRPEARGGFRGRAVVQCEPDGRAGIDRDTRAGDELVGREVDRRRQRQNRRATTSEHTAGLRLREPGMMSPYSGRGAYSTSNATVPSTPVTRRRSADGAPAPSSWPRSLRADRERIDQHRRAGRGPERGLEHHRLGQVPPRDLS